MKNILVIFLISLGIAIFIATPVIAEKNKELVSVSDIKWQKLNPARGDMSPQAGTLWGDRRGAVPTGFLVKFVDGFSSPPHIHNATYRAVVIKGLIHNDDPSAAKMWMPAGSFWTQPKGEVHITAAKGQTNVAFVEIDKGPYLVLPVDQSFDEGERPINLDVSNVVWVDSEHFPNDIKIAYLWGSLEEGRSNGTFVKLPAGFAGQIESLGTVFRAVVVTGQLQYQEAKTKQLQPGSYFGSSDKAIHRVSNENESIVYVHTNGLYSIN